MCIDPITGAMIAISAGSTIFSASQKARAANDQAELVDQQREKEEELFGIRADRVAQQFDDQIAWQTAEIAGAGFQLDSPTALALAQDAAREKQFEVDAVRRTGEARGAELSATARNLRAQAQDAMLGGFISAASGALTQTQDIWPELLA